MCTALVPTGSTGCRPLPGNVHGPGFLSNREAVRQHVSSQVWREHGQCRGSDGGACVQLLPSYSTAEPYGRSVGFEQGSPARHLGNRACDPSEFALSRNLWYTGVEKSEEVGGVGPRDDTPGGIL